LSASTIFGDSLPIGATGAGEGAGGATLGSGIDAPARRSCANLCVACSIKLLMVESRGPVGKNSQNNNGSNKYTQ